MLMCCPRHLNYGARTQTFSKKKKFLWMLGPVTSPQMQRVRDTLFPIPVYLVTRVISPGMGIGMRMGTGSGTKTAQGFLRAWTPV